ncbi:MAG TPA: hypothetical protein VHE99_05570 [Gammaproteobacteria bacterium]|nr:hypothetical protein [Gammaproteobacteria bacterium]
MSDEKTNKTTNTDQDIKNMVRDFTTQAAAAVGLRKEIVGRDFKWTREAVDAIVSLTEEEAEQITEELLKAGDAEIDELDIQTKELDPVDHDYIETELFPRSPAFFNKGKNNFSLFGSSSSDDDLFQEELENSHLTRSPSSPSPFKGI